MRATQNEDAPGICPSENSSDEAPMPMAPMLPHDVMVISKYGYRRVNGRRASAPPTGVWPPSPAVNASVSPLTRTMLVL